MNSLPNPTLQAYGPQRRRIQDEAIALLREQGPRVLNTDWREQAVCRSVGTETMYPAARDDYRPAFMVCSSCPVSSQCLIDALQRRDEWGIWAGTTRNDRRMLRKELEQDEDLREMVAWSPCS